MRQSYSAYCPSRSCCSLRAGYATTSLQLARFWSSRLCVSSPASVAFHGFGHPAVVTVGAVLILSKVLENSGIIDVMEVWYSRVGKRLTVQVFSLSGLVAVLSAFMNNVGALSLMIPLAIRVTNTAKRPFSPYLMPLSFAPLLGGLATLIGTPPNVIIYAFRQEAVGEYFHMFDFTPV